MDQAPSPPPDAARTVPVAPGYVAHVQDGVLTVEAGTREERGAVRALGGKRRLWTKRHEIPYADDEELARLFTRLRDAGFPFLTLSHGWYPGSVFELMRERGQVQGPFTELAFVTGGVRLAENHAPGAQPTPH